MRRLLLGATLVGAISCSGRVIAPGAGARDGAPPSDDAGPVAAELVDGLRADYFRRHGELAASRIDPVVDFTWAAGEPAADIGADRFSVRWSGWIDVPAAGTYTFATTADDGVRLWVGSTLVIEDWTVHAPTRQTAAVELEAGLTPIRLDYFDSLFDAEIHLSWQPAGGAEEIIPSERLRTVADVSAPPAIRSSPLPPYQNPVVPFDCPDPGVWSVGDLRYMVCTGGAFPIRQSADLVLWEDAGGAVLPDGKPPWAANGGRNWAPEIHPVGDRFIAYYTAVNGANVLSIGAAWADRPEGPYTDRGAPLVEAAVGVIDATYFRDRDGRHYLFYKIDGNSQGQPTPMFGRELAADGLSFAPGSKPVQVLVNDPGTWEGGVVEAPWVVERAGTYYLFYSGNVYDHRYRTGVARAPSVLGPYEKRGAPILANNERWVGNGHGSVVTVGEADYLVYHGWSATPAGTHDQGPGRQVLVDRIEWGEDGWPRIHDGTPSRTLQPWPGDLAGQ